MDRQVSFKKCIFPNPVVVVSVGYYVTKFLVYILLCNCFVFALNLVCIYNLKQCYGYSHNILTLMFFHDLKASFNFSPHFHVHPDTESLIKMLIALVPDVIARNGCCLHLKPC